MKEENLHKFSSWAKEILPVIMVFLILTGIFGVIQPAEAAVAPTILSHSSYIDILGDYEIVGEIQNVDSLPICYLEINATYYDSSNTIISTDFTYADLNIMLPNQKSPFQMYLDEKDGASRVDHYTLGVKSYWYTSTLPLDLRILSQSNSIDSYGTIYIKGEVENAGNVNATEPTIYATCYDADGKVVAIGFDEYVREDLFDFFERNNQTPGQKAPFSVYIDSDRAPLVKSYLLSIESDLPYMNKTPVYTSTTPSAYGEIGGFYYVWAAITVTIIVVPIAALVILVSRRRRRKPPKME